jgi:hypothetical protein
MAYQCLVLFLTAGVVRVRRASNRGAPARRLLTDRARLGRGSNKKSGSGTTRGRRWPGCQLPALAADLARHQMSVIVALLLAWRRAVSWSLSARGQRPDAMGGALLFISAAAQQVQWASQSVRIPAGVRWNGGYDDRINCSTVRA